MPFRRRRTLVSRDEVVLFFPTYAYRQSDAWRIVIQGWIYHPRLPWLRRQPVLGLMRRALRVERVHEEAFHRRMRQFLVHCSAGRYVGIRCGDREATIGPSEVAGLIGGEFSLPLHAVAPVTEPTTPHVPWVQFRAVLPQGDNREFVGRAQLLEETGVSLISDVDDTLKHSNVPNRRDLFHNTFLRDFVPIPGMPELYRQCAARGVAFHYVSASPWQLYESLAEFWTAQGYPQGSFHLKRFRLRETARKMRKMSPQKAYKRAAIEPILNAYPWRKFVLVGDSGEQDPEIYADFLRERPQQIAHVCIRMIRRGSEERERLERTFAGLAPERLTFYDDPRTLAQTLPAALDQAVHS
jgi:hypothetical protein